MKTAATYDKCLLDNLLETKQYGEALRYIDSLNVKKNGNLSREEIAHLYFAQAQCLHRLGDHFKAVVKLKCSIRLSHSLNDNALYARQKGTLGHVYYETGRFDKALEEYTESRAFFRRVGDHDRMLIASTAVGLIHFQKGDYQRAIEVNENVMRQARLYRLPLRLRTATFNLCRVLMLTGNLKRVGELLDSVAADCCDPLSQTWLRSLRGMLAVRLLDDESAIKHLEDAMALAREHQYRRDETVCLEYLALNDFYHGRNGEAIDRCTQILATPGVTPSAVAQILWLLTEVYVSVGRLSEAAETGEKAEAAITKVKEWAELGCLHRALALLADKRGDLRAATEHFSQAIEILNRHGARYELATTCLTMGQTSCLAPDLREERLHQAKTLFSEMDIPKRVAQVEKEIEAMEATRRSPKPAPNTAANKGTVRIFTVETPRGSEERTLVAASESMQRMLSLVDRVKNSRQTMLITGETGTGKDLLAEYVHFTSDSAKKPYLPISCVELNHALFESELFGSTRGAFTGADRERGGLLKAAEGGTYVLDEIGDTPLDLQPKLLRVIETKTIRRVGDDRLRPLDVRFIALTNKDLEGMVRRGQFREDLFHRLQRLPLHILPLRERKDDMLVLTQHYLKRLDFGDYGLDEVSLIAQQCGLDRQLWPGNIRQLRNLLEQAVAFAPSRSVMGLISSLGEVVSRLSKSVAVDSERDQLLGALERNGGNQAAAARELGLPPSTFKSRMRRYSL